MSNRAKKLQARFYALPSGRKPVRGWILKLSKGDRVVVGKDIQKVEFGWPIGMPSCRPLGSGFYEVRSDFSDGRIGRVMFCIVKKSQKAPAKDIELARSRQKEIM